MSSINKVIILGNLGADPELRFLQNGDPVCNFRVATSEQWKDKQTGERKEKTEWHTVVVFGNQAKPCGEYLSKGSKVFVEGALQTRKWQTQDGQDRYSTEIVVKGFGSKVTFIDTRSGGGGGEAPSSKDSAPPGGELDDEIPF